MKPYIESDELVVTATIPAAAGKTVLITITALPAETQYPSVTARFDSDGVLMSNSWPIGVLLRCGSDRIVERGTRGTIVDAFYRFEIDSSEVNDFTVRLPGVGGGVVDVNDLERWEDEGISVTYKDGEELYDGMTMAEIRELIDRLVEQRVSVVTEPDDKKCVEETRQQIQAVLDAMNGPDATLDSVKEMFWLLNDLMEALMEATGVQLPNK